MGFSLNLNNFLLIHQKGFFDVHILKGPPGLFSNPEVKLERVYGVVTWETSGEMCMTSNFIPLLLYKREDSTKSVYLFLLN